VPIEEEAERGSERRRLAHRRGSGVLIGKRCVPLRIESCFEYQRCEAFNPER
jgi:hypothetical protein